MLILLVFTIAVYYSVKSKAKIQEGKILEYQEIYADSFEEISKVEYANQNEIIPIYNIDELDVAGTNNYLQIKGKIYQCGREKSYVLKDDVIVDIEEKIKSRAVGFNDYKLYSPTYLIDQASYDLYYYGYGRYWKLVAYKKYENRELQIENDDTEKEFSIINDLKISDKNDLEFILLSFNNDGELNCEDYEKQNKAVLNLYDINVFNKNISNMTDEGEYYIFISIGDSI